MRPRPACAVRASAVSGRTTGTTVHSDDARLAGPRPRTRRRTRTTAAGAARRRWSGGGEGRAARSPRRASRGRASCPPPQHVDQRCHRRHRGCVRRGTVADAGAQRPPGQRRAAAPTRLTHATAAPTPPGEVPIGEQQERQRRPSDRSGSSSTGRSTRRRVLPAIPARRPATPTPARRPESGSDHDAVGDEQPPDPMRRVAGHDQRARAGESHRVARRTASMS